MLQKPKRCPECHNVLGATSRFKQAADLVATPEDVPVIKRIVDRRSETAHQGALHGYESVLGRFLSSFFQPEPEQAFERDAWSMRRIARALLLRALIDGDITSARPRPQVLDPNT